MNYPTFYLECSTKSDVSVFSKTFNRADILNHIWIHFPDSLSKSLTLYDISQVSPSVCPIHMDDNSIEQVCNRPWIKIKSYVFDLSIGYHLYKLMFLHKLTEEVVQLYTSYTVYDSSPDRPYIYMNKNKEVD